MWFENIPYVEEYMIDFIKIKKNLVIFIAIASVLLVGVIVHVVRFNL